MWYTTSKVVWSWVVVNIRCPGHSRGINYSALNQTLNFWKEKYIEIFQISACSVGGFLQTWQCCHQYGWRESSTKFSPKLIIRWQATHFWDSLVISLFWHTQILSQNTARYFFYCSNSNPQHHIPKCVFSEPRHHSKRQQLQGVTHWGHIIFFLHWNPQSRSR